MSSVYVVHNKKSFEGVEHRWKNTIGMEQLVYFKGGKVKPISLGLPQWLLKTVTKNNKKILKINWGF